MRGRCPGGKAGGAAGGAERFAPRFGVRVTETAPSEAGRVAGESEAWTAGDGDRGFGSGGASAAFG